MSKSALNSTLQRPILEGTIYNALFSSSKCTPTFLGKGDTEFTINKMKEWVLKTQKQLDTKQVQQLFSKPSQQATITNIHSFLYNHFQYNADGYDQNLRSPNCAWQQRYSGIDCKSYSILASVLLLKNNIIHYIRRIKQPNFNPTQYTHVYINVPFDQINGDMSKGYYTIDGTLPTMHEPAHLKTDDIFMDKMDHYGLNGSGITDGTNLPDTGDSTTGTDTTTGGTFDNIDLSGLDIDSIDTDNLWSEIGGWFDGIGCWGGSAFSGDQATATGNKILQFFTKTIDELNLAVASNNTAKISDLHATFLVYAHAAELMYVNKRKSNNWNPCTKENIDEMRAIIRYVYQIVHPALTAWLSQYFTMQDTGALLEITFAQGQLEAEPYGFFFTSVAPLTKTAPLFNFTKIAGTTPTQFEFTPEIQVGAQSQSAFSVDSFLNSLTTQLPTIDLGANIGTGTNTGTGTTSGNTTGTGNTPPPQPPATKSNIGTVVGAWLVLAAVGLGVNEYIKSKNTTTKTTKKDAK